MNIEPVAWLLFRDGGESYPEYTTSYKQMREWETYLGDNERIEPHYTTPQIKELSDEEIKDFIATFPIIFTPNDLLSFAKAIIKKASQ